jgi:hypothetical protein
MSTAAKIAVALVLSALACAHDVRAEKKTVCTITVNSPDEKEAFRRNLPADKYQFVELVEKGRSDWLASACSRRIRCDVLVISGHYDGGNEFFSDQIASREYLPVDEMERVSCSQSCPGLFSELKEVYLFGCNTLNPEANKSASSEIARSLVRYGHSPAEAERLARALSLRHGESSRDRMQQIFMNVPAIYGFSSVAPLGPLAASILNRHFQANGIGDVGTGRPNGRLLASFSAQSLALVPGLTGADPRMLHRQDVCRFSDDRLSAAQRLAFVHGLIDREMAEARMFLDRIERFTATIPDAAERPPDLASALDDLAHDTKGRTRYLEFARDADQPAVRARMIDIAARFGWLSASEKQDELMRMIGEQLARRTVSPADVDLACALNDKGALAGDVERLPAELRQSSDVGHAALLACLGNASGRTRVLEGLTSPNEQDVQIAQVYLRKRPITDVDELRTLTAGIAHMNGSAAQVRALDTLAGQRLSDPQALESLTRLYPVAETPGVQSAIAGVLIRSDFAALATPELVRMLREHRLRAAGGGDDIIDALLRRLQAMN